jgi:hypothetical protein
VTLDDDELRAQSQRWTLIREALAAGSPVVMRLHPHLHAPGYAIYAEHGPARIYACTLVSETLPVVFDADLVVLNPGADPEATVRAWLSRKFPGVSLANVRVEPYVEPTGSSHVTGEKRP